MDRRSVAADPAAQLCAVAVTAPAEAAGCWTGRGLGGKGATTRNEKKERPKESRVTGGSFATLSLLSGLHAAQTAERLLGRSAAHILDPFIPAARTATDRLTLARPRCGRARDSGLSAYSAAAGIFRRSQRYGNCARGIRLGRAEGRGDDFSAEFHLYRRRSERTACPRARLIVLIGRPGVLNRWGYL